MTEPTRLSEAELERLRVWAGHEDDASCRDCASMPDEHGHDTECPRQKVRALVEEVRRLRVDSTELEMELRRTLWLSHGHRGLYGDDGEMQCAECLPFGVCDYKREPLEKIREAQTRRAHAAIAEAQRTCSHKFVDSKWCLKCGWMPPEEARDAS